MKNNKLLVLKYTSILFVFLLFFANQLEVIFIGQGDVRNYKYLIDIKMIGSQITEPFLKFLIIILNYITDNSSLILLSINVITFLLIIFLTQLFVKNNLLKEILLILMMGLSVALLSSIQTTMRQGVGYIFFFYFIYSIISSYKLRFSLFILILASLCHNIFIIIGALMLFLQYFNIYNKSLNIFLLFLFLFLFSIFFLNDFLFFIQEFVHRQTYTNYSSRQTGFSSNYKIGIRLDFISFNLLFILMILFVKKFNFKLLNNQDKIYINLLFSSIIAGIIFREFPYIDRFFYVSWVFIPILLAKYIQNKLLIFVTIIFILSNYLYFPKRYEFNLLNIRKPYTTTQPSIKPTSK